MIEREDSEPDVGLMEKAQAQNDGPIVPFRHELLLGGKDSVRTWPDEPGGGRSLPS